MATVSEQIQKIYIGLLGRAADQEGLNYWSDEIEDGALTLEQLRANIVEEQPEYAAGLGQMSRAQAVNQLYENLFERSAEDEGLDYWVNGGGAEVNFDQLVLALVESASAADTLVLDNKADVAQYYTEQTGADYAPEAARAAVDDVDGTSASVAQAKADIDAGTLSGFDLTNGTDNATANVFNAGQVYNPGGTDRINSLQDEDVLNGEGDNPTLNATLGNANDNGATIITPELNGIETANVAFTGSGGNAVNALDLQDATGLNELNITRVSQAVNSAELGNIQNAVESMSIADTNANQAGVVEFSYGAGALAGENTTSLSLDNVSLNTVNVGQNTSGIAGRGVGAEGYENLTLNSIGAANTVGTINLPMDTGTEGTITITGDQDLTLAGNTQITNAASGQQEALLFNGGIAGNFGRLANVDASALEGSLTLNIAAGMLSAGKADTSGVQQDVTITGSAQADTFYLNDTVGAGDTIEGGEGEDTLVVYTGGVTAGTVSNVENVDVQLTGNVTMDMGQLADAESVNVRNIDNNGVNSANTGNYTATLNNLNVTQAANISLQHSTTGSNGLANTTLVANLADDTGADDTVAVELTDGVNVDPRFNFSLNTNAVENVTLTDSDTESNSVLLQNVPALTGTLTLAGGAEGDFLNLDSTGNLYRYDQSGATAGDQVGVVDVAAGAAERLVAETIDASGFAGDVVVRVSDANGTTGAQDITMGTGNDTVIFDDLNDNTAGLTISDSVDGGEGDDVLAIDGDGTNINISASEWTNVSNFETVHLVGNGQADNNAQNTANAYNLTLTDDFISNNGEAVTGGRLINIVNDNDPANSVDTAATAGTGANAGVTVDARQLSANRNFSYDGEEGAARTADRFIMSDANINGLAVIDGGAVFADGTGVASSVANADVMEVRNASVVTIGDLENVSNVGTLEFTNDRATTQTNTLVLDSETVDRLVNTTRDADSSNVETLTISAFDNPNVTGANSVLELDARLVDNVGLQLNVTGDDGNDTFTGGRAADTFTGGAGDDTFAYTAANQSSIAAFDTITDFTTGDDTIDLQSVLGGGGVNPASIHNAGTVLNGSAGEFVGGDQVAFHDDGTDTTVYVDVDSSGNLTAGDMQIELAGVTGGGVPVAGDFLV